MMFKTLFGVTGGILLYKSLHSFAETVEECREIYNKNIQQLNNDEDNIPTPPKQLDEIRTDAVTALVNLGYKVKDSQTRVNKAINEGGCTNIQDILKYVLTNNQKN